MSRVKAIVRKRELIAITKSNTNKINSDAIIKKVAKETIKEPKFTGKFKRHTEKKEKSE